MELNQAIKEILECRTDGSNYDIETEDIVERLTDWSKKFKFEVLEVDYATVKLKLESLPENLADFCQEIYEFCPDVIEQEYATLAYKLSKDKELGEVIEPENLALIDGLDPEAEDFSLRVMERNLPRVMKLTLWWD